MKSLVFAAFVKTSEEIRWKEMEPFDVGSGCRSSWPSFSAGFFSVELSQLTTEPRCLVKELVMKIISWSGF